MIKAKTKRTKKRTVAQSVRGVRYRDRIVEADGVYFLKLVVVVLLSTLWLKLATPLTWNNIPLGGFPIGAMIAVIGIRLLEKDLVDRKIWFAVLVMVTILSYFVPAGVVI